MNKYLLLISLLLLLSIKGFSQTPSPQERAVQLSATTQTNPPQINLTWKADNGATEYVVHRKGLNDTNWGSPIATLPGSATSYTDNNVQVGVGYEYAFFKEDFSNYETNVCVPAGTPLQFTINDSNGIGVCCSFGDGFYEVRSCNNVITSGDDFGSSESTNFTACNDGSGCTDIFITIKPSMIDNSTSWSLQNTQTGQQIASAGGPGQFLRPRPEYGFIYAGINLPPVEDRGRILLVVEDDLLVPLATQIEELKMDYIKDGWRVSQIDVDKNDPVTSVQSAIKNVYNTQSDLEAVFLLGNIPIAYSGSIFPDTHTENEGAYPADVYYGEMNGTWTDFSVNTTLPFLDIYHNVPGDGRFDQAVPPSGVVELQVGRVDFANMSSFNQNETQLLQQYLDKNHDFKTREFNPTRRALIDDNLGLTIAAPAASGWRNFATMFGANNITEADYFGTMNSQSYLWSYGAGSGSANSAAGIGTTNDFSNSNLQTVFTMLFGSQFGNWAFANSLLRAPLASGQTLASAYSGNPPWALHHMSMGYHIGYSLLQTQNNTNDEYLPYGPALVSTALMGDPTLRMHIVKPPSNFQVSNNSNSVALSWNAPSGETVVGYNIYRASNVDGTFQKINNNTITGTSYTDSNPLNGNNIYLVKSLKLEISGSGTYFNLSLGEMGSTNFVGNVDTTPPTASLSTSSNNVTTSFTVDVLFSENINGLSLSDFNVSNGSSSNLSGNGSSYSFTVTPSSAGNVTIVLPSQTVTDLAVNSNTISSNTLNITYNPDTNTGGGCNAPMNLALNKSATQQSEQFNASASRAVDGNTDGNFWGSNSVSLTSWTSQPWWEVDLGIVSAIDDILVYNRTDCCQDFLNNYYVIISEEPFTSTDLNATLNQSGVESFLQNTQAGTPSNIPINSNGRYVRIQLIGQGFLALAEVEVMGCPDPNQGGQTQNINFSLLDDKLTIDPAFGISATATSGLPVSFSILSGPASISGNTVSLTGSTGEVSIRATQSGNSQFDAATPIVRTFTVSLPSGGGCDSPSNIALNRSATQSGTQFGANASRAVDGNTDGNFWVSQTASLTNWVNNAWWQVDLGQVSDIETINLWNRIDCCQDLFSNFYVLVSDAPFNSTDLNTTINQPGVTSYLNTGTAGLPSSIAINRTGRYVRVQLIGTAFLAIAEVEVIGCQSGAGCPAAGTPCNDGNSNTQNDVEDGNCNCTGTPINSGCTSTTNVALNKMTNQSSTLTASGITGSASKAVDGNTNGTFFSNPASASSVTATNQQFEPWWQVDLGSEHLIEEIKVYNRTDGTDKSQNAFVLVSNTPFTTTDLSTAKSQATFEHYISGLVGSPSTINLSNVEGRYIRVQMEGNGHLVLAEVEVMGCANNFNNNTSTLISIPQAVDFQVVKNEKEANLYWSSNRNDITNNFIVERSVNGIDFAAIDDVPNLSNAQGFIFYEKNDETPVSGENYYRLRLMQNNGTELFSPIRKVRFDVDWEEIFIFPNPAKDEIRVNLEQYLGRNIKIQIFDARGVLQDFQAFESLEEVQPIFDLHHFENGLYWMVIEVEGFSRLTRKFVVEKAR